jgi:hypothetical protein
MSMCPAKVVDPRIPRSLQADAPLTIQIYRKSLLDVAGTVNGPLVCNGCKMLKDQNKYSPLLIGSAPLV